MNLLVTMADQAGMFVFILLLILLSPFLWVWDKIKCGYCVVKYDEHDWVSEKRLRLMHDRSDDGRRECCRCGKKKHW